MELENLEQRYYPYLDTFKHYNVGKKRLSNSDGFRFDYILEREEEPEEEPEYWGDDDDY